MIEGVLYVALGCAAVSILLGSRTAWVLVPAVIFCLWMQAEEVAFSRNVWRTIDLVAMMLIYGLSKKMGRVEWSMLALFPVAWVFYELPDPYRYFGTNGVTIFQLLLTFPGRDVGQVFRRLVARWKANFQHRDEWTDLERRGQREANV